MSAESVRVLLLSGHALSRYGLSAALRSQPGIDVIAEADNPAKALTLVSDHDPGVVVLDTVHPGRRAAQITSLLLDRPASLTPAVLIVANKICSCAPAVVRAGAHGLLLKDAEPVELAGAVRGVASGYMIMPASLVRCACPPERQPRNTCDPAKLRTLSEREIEVLRRVVAGSSNAEIARDLHIGEGTVKSHVQHILCKLGVRDRIRTVIYAYDVGFVQGENPIQPAVLQRKAS